MAISLQDQLKKAGLVDDKKASQLKRAKQKETKLARKGKGSKVDERKQELDRIRIEQATKDKKLNQEKNTKAQHKAINAQIRQLIETNLISASGDKKYSFADANKIKHLWISQQQVDQLSRGSIAIVRHAGKYALVPTRVADKIMQRDPAIIAYKSLTSETTDVDDPYADYKIPDDLDW